MSNHAITLSPCGPRNSFWAYFLERKNHERNQNLIPEYDVFQYYNIKKPINNMIFVVFKRSSLNFVLPSIILKLNMWQLVIGHWGVWNFHLISVFEPQSKNNNFYIYTLSCTYRSNKIYKTNNNFIRKYRLHRSVETPYSLLRIVS